MQNKSKQTKKGKYKGVLLRDVLEHAGVDIEKIENDPSLHIWFIGADTDPQGYGYGLFTFLQITFVSFFLFLFFLFRFFFLYVCD